MEAVQQLPAEQGNNRLYVIMCPLETNFPTI